MATYDGVFVDASGRSLTIAKAAETSKSYRIRVALPAVLDAALSQHPDYPFEISGELRGRLGQVQDVGEVLKIEAGALRLNGLGPTLNLKLVSPDALKPSLGLGVYDDWEDDLGLPWAMPLSIYYRQTTSK